MKFNFKELEQDTKIMFTGLVLAVVSLFLPWSVFWEWPQNAFLEGEFLISLPLMYPLTLLLLGKKPHFLGASVAIGLPLIAGVILLSIYYSDPNQDPGVGLYLFISACFASIYGHIKSGRSAS